MAEGGEEWEETLAGGVEDNAGHDKEVHATFRSRDPLISRGLQGLSTNWMKGIATDHMEGCCRPYLATSRTGPSRNPTLNYLGREQ